MIIPEIYYTDKEPRIFHAKSVKQRRSEDRQRREAIRHMLDISMKQYRKLEKSVRKGANEDEVRKQISRWNGDMKSVYHFGTETKQN